MLSKNNFVKLLREDDQEDESLISSTVIGRDETLINMSYDFDHFVHDLFEKDTPYSVAFPSGSRSIFSYFIDLQVLYFLKYHLWLCDVFFDVKNRWICVERQYFLFLVKINFMWCWNIYIGKCFLVELWSDKNQSRRCGPSLSDLNDKTHQIAFCSLVFMKVFVAKQTSVRSLYRLFEDFTWWRRTEDSDSEIRFILKVTQLTCFQSFANKSTKSLLSGNLCACFKTGRFIPWDDLVPGTRTLIERGLTYTLVGGDRALISDHRKSAANDVTATLVPTTDTVIIVFFTFWWKLWLVWFYDGKQHSFKM